MKFSLQPLTAWWAKIPFGGVIGYYLGYVFRANIAELFRYGIDETAQASSGWGWQIFTFANKHHASSWAYNNYIPIFTAFLGIFTTYLPQALYAAYAFVRSNFSKNNRPERKLECTPIKKSDGSVVLSCIDVSDQNNQDKEPSTLGVDPASASLAIVPPPLTFLASSSSSSKLSCSHGTVPPTPVTDSLLVGLASRTPDNSSVLAKVQHVTTSGDPTQPTCTHTTTTTIAIQRVNSSPQIQITPVSLNNSTSVPLIEELDDSGVNDAKNDQSSEDERRLVVRPS